MRTDRHIMTQTSHCPTGMHLRGWSVQAAKSDAGVVSVTFTARKINPRGKPGGLLRERQQ